MLKKLANIFVGLLLTASAIGQGTWYFSSVNGNDGNAGTSESPWLSVAKLQTVLDTCSTGTTIKFERGSTWWNVYLYIDNQTLTFEDYGTGEKPKFYGHKIMTDVVSVGGNIYRAFDAGIPTSDMLIFTNQYSNPSYFNYCAPLLVNDTMFTLGRYPNTGYLDFELVASDRLSWAQDNNASWTSNQWQLGHIRYVPVNSSDIPGKWVNKAARITSNGINTLDLNQLQNPEGWRMMSTGTYGEKIKYLITNHYNTLDQDGEYSIDYANRYVYFYSSTYQTGDTVAFSVTKEVFNLVSAANFTMNNLSLYGSYQRTVRVHLSNNFTADSCDFRYSATVALGFDMSSNATVTNCTFKDGYGEATTFYSADGVISNNRFENIGIWDVAGGDRDHRSYDAIYIQGRTGSVHIHHNLAFNLGYCFVDVNGESSSTVGDFIIEKNLVVNPTVIVSDGGLLHDFREDLSRITGYDKRVVNNVVIDTIFNVGFMPDNKTLDMLYYMDAKISDWEIDSNVGYGANVGIFTHPGDYLTMRNNSFKNNGNYATTSWAAGIFISEDYSGHPAYSYMSNSTITGNKIVSTNANNKLITWVYNGAYTNASNIVNNNYLSYQFGTQPYADMVSWSIVPKTVAEFQSATGFSVGQHNANGITGLNSSHVKLIASTSDVNDTVDLYDLVMKDIHGTTYQDSVIIAPWDEIFLFYVSGTEDSLNYITEVGQFTSSSVPDPPPVVPTTLYYNYKFGDVGYNYSFGSNRYNLFFGEREEAPPPVSDTVLIHTYKLNIASANPQTSGWYNYYFDNTTYSNIVDSVGLTTATDFVTADWAGLGSFGINSGDNSCYFPDYQMVDYWYINPSTSVNMRFDQLTGDLVKLELVASRGSVTLDRTAQVIVNGVVQNMDARNNCDNAVIYYVQPTAGTVTITIQTDASNYGYINAIRVKEYTIN